MFHHGARRRSTTTAVNCSACFRGQTYYMHGNKGPVMNFRACGWYIELSHGTGWGLANTGHQPLLNTPDRTLACLSLFVTLNGLVFDRQARLLRCQRRVATLLMSWHVCTQLKRSSRPTALVDYHVLCHVCCFV
jgi:hypothetical protein